MNGYGLENPTDPRTINLYQCSDGKQRTLRDLSDIKRYGWLNSFTADEFHQAYMFFCKEDMYVDDWLEQVGGWLPFSDLVCQMYEDIESASSGVEDDIEEYE